MKNKKLAIIVAAIVAVVVILTLFTGRNAKAGKNNMEGYSKVDSVEGVEFYVNSAFVDKSTAVTEISDAVEFQKDLFYSYRNGIDKYMLFNISDLVIAAQKGTTFNLTESNDKEAALKDSNLMGIWFDKGSKNLECEVNEYTSTTKVLASVSVNKDVYGDFCGILKTISRDGEEWSIFVGIPGERFDKLSSQAQAGIEAIVNTFNFIDNSEQADNSIYAITLDGKGQKEKVDTEALTSESKYSLGQTNQNEVIKKDGELAYTSSQYAMLSLGDNGILSIFNENTTRYEDAIICPKAVYRGGEAEDIIKDFCETTKQYEYQPCSDGSSWEVVEYDLNYAYCESDTSGYVNIKVRGVDGQRLNYQDNTYTGRTYDMVYKTQKDGNWVRHFYVYYAVPNGCTEYCITAGENDSVNGERCYAAFYRLTEKDTKVEVEPSPEPSIEPSVEPSIEPSEEPSEEPSPEPSEEPSEKPSKKPAGNNKKQNTTTPKQETVPQTNPAPEPAPAVPVVPADNGGSVVVGDDSYTIIN